MYVHCFVWNVSDISSAFLWFLLYAEMKKERANSDDLDLYTVLNWLLQCHLIKMSMGKVMSFNISRNLLSWISLIAVVNMQLLTGVKDNSNYVSPQGTKYCQMQNRMQYIDWLNKNKTSRDYDWYNLYCRRTHSSQTFVLARYTCTQCLFCFHSGHAMKGIQLLPSSIKALILTSVVFANFSF